MGGGNESTTTTAAAAMVPSCGYIAYKLFMHVAIGGFSIVSKSIRISTLVSIATATRLIILMTITHCLIIESCEGFSLLRPSKHNNAAVGRRFYHLQRQHHQGQVLRLSETSESMLENQFETLIKAATVDAQGRVLGGDFAGLAATFSPGDGSLIEIPGHLIPEALKEWGQEPRCLEVLVSEDFINENDALIRNTVTILPDTGCGIDNLETVKASDEIDLTSKAGNEKVAALQYSTADEELRVETIFGLNDGYRMRVIIDMYPSDPVFEIKSPMALILERRTSASSSGGTIADGGGLDGRTVSMLLGKLLRKVPTFAEAEPSDVNFASEGMQFVSLPGNISIAYGWLADDEWVLQVSHVDFGRRCVVSRQFTLADNADLDFDVEMWEEDA